MVYLHVNSIMSNPSLCDGTGYRTVVFLQGCDIHCKGCQNRSTWSIDEGTKFTTDQLADLIKEKAFNKKVTFSGGEPLLQKEALLEVIKKLEGFDICLYTGHLLSDVPKEMLKYLKYVKVGPFVESLKTTIKPFVGSSNQEFIEVKHHEQTKQKR